MKTKATILVMGDSGSVHLAKWTNPFVNDFNIHVASCSENKLADNICFHALRVYPEPHMNFVFNLARINTLIRTIQPDLIHAHYASTYGLLAAMSCSSCPKLLSTWGSDVAMFPKSYPYLVCLLRWILRQFDWINVPSEHLKKALLKFRVRESIIDVFQYGVDASIIQKRRHEAKPKYKLLSNRGWSSLYRIKHIISGFEQYAERYKDLELVLVGTGSANDERKINKCVAESSVRDSINLVKRIDHDKMLRMLSECDVFVSIPISDGTPLSLLEAMAAGLFPVLSDIEANREWAREPNAIFVKDIRADKLAEAIRLAVIRVQNHYDGKINEQTIRSRGDYHTNIQRLHKVYLEMMRSGK